VSWVLNPFSVIAIFLVTWFVLFLFKANSTIVTFVQIVSVSALIIFVIAAVVISYEPIVRKIKRRNQRSKNFDHNLGSLVIETLADNKADKPVIGSEKLPIKLGLQRMKGKVCRPYVKEL
jgi:hypothetical protein